MHDDEASRTLERQTTEETDVLIGEVADATGVTTRTLRYYERQGLLHEPDRTSGGYRDYRPQDVDRVTFIKRAQGAGLTLAQIGEILQVRDGGRPPCDHVAALVDTRLAEVDQRLAELEHTRAQLRELRRRLDDLEAGRCRPDDICVALSGL